ncbi:hypothetical protein Bhyg_10564 [Pseudolycoriella hygida]|uniref:Uncharacterized protein n=1 Tax=Pseudolycoriella hygida TaxID=35572 RepID=A0A9Q0RZF4_9DIPT|nr:hypothetical protein Bhyg_10564 [Pseudolycoriella hygida]
MSEAKHIGQIEENIFEENKWLVQNKRCENALLNYSVLCARKLGRTTSYRRMVNEKARVDTKLHNIPTTNRDVAKRQNMP